VSLWAVLFSVVFAEVLLDLKEDLGDFMDRATLPGELKSLPAYTAMRIRILSCAPELYLHIDTSGACWGKIQAM
jgi:hypothetical protein